MSMSLITLSISVCGYFYKWTMNFYIVYVIMSEINLKTELITLKRCSRGVYWRWEKLMYCRNVSNTYLHKIMLFSRWGSFLFSFWFIYFALPTIISATIHARRKNNEEPKVSSLILGCDTSETLLVSSLRK